MSLIPGKHTTGSQLRYSDTVVIEQTEYPYRRLITPVIAAMADKILDKVNICLSKHSIDIIIVL